MLKEARQQALELLRDKKALRRALKQQLAEMPPKIARTSDAPPAEKKPLGRLEIVICIVFTLFSLGMIGWNDWSLLCGSDHAERRPAIR